MKERPVIILHGYSDNPESADRWEALLEGAGYDATQIHIGGYVSLSNEITIKDVAEAFDRALNASIGTASEFDAIVHSTGMLVIRAWLTSYGLSGAVGEARRGRLKHLIGLAPATFGSPMAHKGRSWIGALVKGSREVGHPDFLEAGDQVLSALELGSKYTWQLAEQDLLGDVYGPDARTPYPFVLIGNTPYGGLRKVVNQAGTDGTVRWAGCGFNTRKIMVDLSLDPALEDGTGRRASVVQWHNELVPLAFVDGHDHNTIFASPGTEKDPLVRAVCRALEVGDSDAYTQWAAEFADWDDERLPPVGGARYQQFVTRLVDERGDGVPDYYLELCDAAGGRLEPLDGFEQDVHAWREDSSYRCFHVDLNALAGRSTLELRVSARSGTSLVAYYGHDSERMVSAQGRPNPKGVWDARIKIPTELQTDDGRPVKLFYPFTTTLLEIRLNREPLYGNKGQVFWWHRVIR
jgi:hypothetical protein